MCKVIKVESLFFQSSSGCFGFSIGVIGQLLHNSAIFSKDVVDVSHDGIVIAIRLVIKVIATLIVAKLLIGSANKFFPAVNTKTIHD
jgi:hypothetical protein